MAISCPPRFEGPLAQIGSACVRPSSTFAERHGAGVDARGPTYLVGATYTRSRRRVNEAGPHDCPGEQKFRSPRCGQLRGMAKQTKAQRSRAGKKAATTRKLREAGKKGAATQKLK